MNFSADSSKNEMSSEIRRASYSDSNNKQSHRFVFNNDQQAADPFL